MNLCLINEKCLMICNQGTVLGHRISNKGIKVDLAKVSVIVNLPRPQKQKGCQKFFGSC